MKRIVLSFVAISIFATSIIGCKKETNFKNVPTVKEELSYDPYLVEKINASTKKYTKRINNQTSNKVSRWAAILAADLKGALKGAGIGAGIGSLIGGVGAGGGAIIGGVLEGAAESLNASGIANPNRGNSSVDVKNELNQYELAGLAHYEIVNQVLMNYNLLFVDGKLNESNYYQYVIDFLDDTYDREILLNNFRLDNIRVNLTKNESAQSLIAFVNGLSTDKATKFEKDVLVMYFTALNKSNDVAKFANYSREVEGFISESTLLDESKRKLLLTRRHYLYNS